MYLFKYSIQNTFSKYFQHTFNMLLQATTWSLRILWVPSTSVACIRELLLSRAVAQMKNLTGSTTSSSTSTAETWRSVQVWNSYCLDRLTAARGTVRCSEHVWANGGFFRSESVSRERASACGDWVTSDADMFVGLVILLVLICLWRIWLVQQLHLQLQQQKYALTQYRVVLFSFSVSGNEDAESDTSSVSLECLQYLEDKSTSLDYLHVASLSY